MNPNGAKNYKDYFYKQVKDFDESTILTPNLNGEKESGILVETRHEIKKEGLSEFCMDNSITLTSLFLASVSLALNKFNFTHNNLIYQGKNIPFSTNLEKRSISIMEFLDKIHKDYNENSNYGNCPTKEILDEYGLIPEFHYNYNESLKIYPENTRYSNILNITEDGEKIILSFFYNDHLYTNEYIEIFLKSIETIAKQIIDCEVRNTCISDIAIVKEKENIEFNKIELPYLHKRFERQVEKTPDNTALVSNGETLTYDELNRKANRIANALIKRGVEPKSNILIMLPRTSDLIASILGVLKAGCAFIPMDMEYPQERIEYIYTNSEAEYIISNETGANLLNIEELLNEEDTANPDVDITPDDLAYMIYTSGSTGNPKGVMIGHENICNLVEYVPKKEYRTLLSMTTISFDVSLEDIFASLTNGLELIFANDIQIKSTPELVRLIDEYKPEIMDLTPSRLATYLEVQSFCEAVGCIKCLFLGGEKFKAEVYEEFIKHNSEAIVYNSYGPTETTITSNNKIITDPTDITVGPAVENYICDVRDIDGKLLPQGVMGELYIGGCGVGKGYYKLPEKTEEAFLEINGIPYYRSGDYAIQTPNEEIDIKGRIDNQIKLRGLRIEIGEIESNIANYPHIRQSVVVIKQINSNDHLCAYFTSDEEIDTEDLKEYLKERLTRYMVPTVFMQLDEMPQTPNGKTDLKQLPEPELNLSLTLPESETEEALLDIASSLTETSEFGTTDDLYAVGFTSLTLMKFNAIIYEQMGVNLNIIELLNNPTIRNIAEQVDNSNADSLDLERLAAIAKDTEFYPLTSNQLGVYYECIQSKEEARYNLPSIIRFDSDIDADKLKEAIIDTIESYPYLKTRIVSENGKLMQKRDDSIAIEDIPIVETENIDDDEIEMENIKTFDLQDSQLFRFKIYKTAAETILFSDFHHLITDGESLDNFFNNIANAYQGNDLDKEGIDGYLNSIIEKEYDGGEEYESSRKYFEDKLTQKGLESTILTPNLNGNEDEGALETISMDIDPKQINAFCCEKKISPNVLILASTALTLNKYTFSDKTLLTTIFNGRSNPNYSNTQAFLVKTIPFISINDKRDITIDEYLKQFNELWKDTIDHSNYPYTKIAEEYQLKPEFFYAYNNLDSEELEINGKSYNVKYLETVETNYKITFDVNETKENLEFLVKYNNELYSEEYLKTFLECILNTISEFIAGDTKKLKINDIELNKDYEIPTFTPVEPPVLHQRFEKQVQEHPDEIALVAADSTLTYGELNVKSNRIANALIRKGVKAKSNVLVMLPRNSDLIAAIMGILKAGCAFIPIDLEYPQERINYIYENSQADYIITNESNENSLNVNELLKEEDTSNPDVNVNSDDTAYMIYTSGSTGKPKGVMISHENISNQVQNPKSQYRSLLCLATISFDVSLDDILTSLSNGMKLILASDSEIKNIQELIELIEKNRPEVSEITPSRLASYLEVKEFCEVIGCVKCMFLGGEQFSAKAYEDLRKYSDAIVYNSYGPTETTITSNNKEVTDINDLTVGLPLDNYVTDVRDIDGKLLPEGVMGELYIGGLGVGKGYYNMPEKTAEAFLSINDIPYYRSGDYAIQTPEGEIDIKGRIDDQIKLRGLRIEIGEIETNIGKYPKIKQNAVVIKEINNNDHLCAYFTAEEEIDENELKEFLADKLTKYMVPTVFMQIDEMPETPNGKTDIKRLPKPVLKLENVKPENETEEKLFEIASELIDTQEFGTTDELYKIGYTSLTLMKFNSIIYEEMGANLDISILFDNPTIRRLAEEIRNDDSDDSYLDNLIELSESMKHFPLTENQMGIYYECMQSPDEIKYTMPTVIRFDSSIDVDRLKDAVIRTIEAHPYLKTRIVTAEDGTLKQERNDDAEINEIEIVETESVTDEEIIENDVKPFKVNDEQLFRFKIYKTPNEIVLFSDFHHIITDGVSQGILSEDIQKAYENKEIKKERVNGYVYSLIESDIENSEKYEESKRFFQEKLTQEIDSTILTPNLSGNPDEGNIKRVLQTVNPDKIRAFCKDNFISPNALFLSATILNLNKYTFSDKTLITTIFNGRADPNYYNTQGFLVKTLPFTTKNENRQQTISQFINRIDKTWKDSINNSYYPYTKIAEEFKLKPEFFFAYQEFFESESVTIDGKTYEGKELSDGGFATTTYKTNFTVTDTEDSIELQIEYNDQIYSKEYIETFLNSIRHILNEFIENDIDDVRICDIELEKTKEIPEFKTVETPFIHKRFERQAEKTPDDIALVASNETLTYKELNEKANCIANGLIKHGIKPKSNILIMLPRNSHLILGIMGVLKAGCAYIPIDLEYPAERIEYIYNNSEADYIISGETTENSIDIEELLLEGNSRTPNVDMAPEDTAYMIYTSGSTGKPKGVMISHKNICSLFSESEENPTYREYQKINRALSITTVSFDPFLLDLMSLTFGIELVLANDDEVKNIQDLTELIHREKPDAIPSATPSRIMQYLEYEGFRKELPNLRYIVTGGEMMPKELASKLVENTDIALYNGYGPTETTVMSNSKLITDPEDITIGKALHNYVTDVRDIDGKLLPQGVMGELYIGGVGVGKGYYNMPEKTAETYLTINDIPYYRSGDYAIELPNGEIDVRGRIDNQIKLRGLRIEIGEIESNISRFPRIRQVAVAIKNINDNDHLCAYFTADEEIDKKLLKRYLKSKLTKYMVPTAFVQLDEMPQTPNGKTDVKQLPIPELDLENVKAENETEEKILKYASEIIDTDAFGTTDDLYALGFTSLTLMKLNSMIFNETGVNIDIGSLFSNPTIKSLADKVDNNIESNIDIDEIIKTAKGMDYFPLTANQLGIYYECMQTDKIKYTMPRAIRFDDSIDPNKLKKAVIKTVNAHPYLKTRIVSANDGKIMQKRCDDAEIDEIEIVEIDSISNEEIMEADIKAIPLDNNQLFRFKIYKTQTETILFSDFHHIITDGVSQENLFNDLTKAYNNEEIESEKINGYAYSLLEEETILSEVSDRFFKDQFSQGIESTVLTPDMNGNPDIGNIKIISDEVNSTFVRHFCQDHSISPNVLFMATTLLSLNKFTFSDKSLITTIFNGRANSNFFNTQGMLVKTLPIIVNAENREMMVEDYMKIVDKSWKDALTHSDYPYTQLAEDYQLKPEFLYAYHEAFSDEIFLENRSYEAVDLDGTVATDYKINFNIYDDGETISLHLEYNDQIYSEEYAELFLHSIKYILFQFFTNDMDKYRLNDVKLKEEKTYEFSEVETPYIHKRFERQVEETPDNMALVACDDRLTYKELNQKANRIANALIKKGIEPKSNIMIMLPRTSNLISAILGVLKAGCAFIPIDIEYPKGRIDYIFENSESNYLISDGRVENSLDVEKLLLEDDISNPKVDIDPNDLAYMIYTSGSTGNPKGVMTSHMNITNLFSKTEDNLICKTYSKMNKTIALSTVSFDAFLLDFMPLTFGTEIIFANDDEIKNIKGLTDLIKREKPDSLTFVAPSRFKQYLDYDEFAEQIPNLRYVGIGGEMVPSDLIARLIEYPDLEIYNIYGPTETTVTSNSHKITDPNNLTVGTALHNCITEVRDIDGKVLPSGIMGELYIGGYGVARGYYNLEEKTKEAFLTINDIPYYKSGDYAIELPDGNIVIKGRIDNQIKLRGLRIEIGEVESNIAKYPDIKQTAVVIRKINNNEHLCAYFTAEEEIDTNDLKEFLTQHLTKYMVPTVFMQIDEFPISPNGKTDMKQLPEPKLDLNYVAPETKLEQEICAIFSATLNIETVGAEDNFFEIGGTSLVASKLIIELLKQGYSVRYDDIFNNKTPRALAKLLSGESSPEEEFTENDIYKDYNYDEINELLDENTLENFLDGEKQELGNVLLTGATGFLGIHILYEFLKNEEGKIYCMLRKGNFDSCEERLIDLMNYYFDEDFTDMIGKRIIPIEGDITEIDDFKKLEDKPIDTIINSAAVVKHYTADDYIFRVNVDGVINGLKFAQTRNSIRYVQISTLSVLSSYSMNEEKYPNPEYSERTLYYEQDLTNKYVGSKFLAERNVLEAGTKGLSVKIIRVGNLMSRYSDGMFQKNYDTNAFLNNIKAVAKLKAINPIMANEKTDMSQIDYVAKGILKLSKTPEKNRVFHLKNNHYVSQRDIINALNASGYGISEVSVDEFKQIYEENMNENIQGLITADLTIDELDEGDEFYNMTKLEQTLEILHSLGFDWPEANVNYLKRVINHLNTLGFFE